MELTHTAAVFSLTHCMHSLLLEFTTIGQELSGWQVHVNIQVSFFSLFLGSFNNVLRLGRKCHEASLAKMHKLAFCIMWGWPQMISARGSVRWELWRPACQGVNFDSNSTYFQANFYSDTIRGGHNTETYTCKSTPVYIDHPLSNTWEQHCCRRHILKLYRIIDGSGERICRGSKCMLVLVRQTLPRQVSTFVETGKNIGWLNLSLKQWSAICQTGGFSWIVALIPTSPPCSTTKWLPDFANNHWWSTKND